MKIRIPQASFTTLLASFLLLAITAQAQTEPPSDAKKTDGIKSFCLDFNWSPSSRRGKPLAKPGTWATADPARHVDWYEKLGVNVIQTFCVSTNGYAWYKNGFVPEQPGLKHDFLPEMVKLGHAKGMKVMGYFCIACNPRWGAENPELSYGTPSTYHIPYTDEYLTFLSKSISDAVTKTGIDGFMIDWLWMPNRKANKGAWLDCEKDLFKQLMGKQFPGKDKLSREDDLAYSRKAIDRCWTTIHKAAKEANPKCLIWLTVNKMHHPHAINSKMYKEADWLMNEAGSLAAIKKVEPMVSKNTQLITCMAVWNGADASKAVPEALANNIGLYGFATPRGKHGIIPMEGALSSQVSELFGDSKNLAILSRAYRGLPSYAEWKDGKFVVPENPPPFEISFKGRSRGLPDTAKITHDGYGSTITVKTPYATGRGLLTRTSEKWPAKVTIQLQRNHIQAANVDMLRVVSGELTVLIPLDGKTPITYKKIKSQVGLRDPWDSLLAETKQDGQVKAKIINTKALLEIILPAELFANNPAELGFDWTKAKK